MKNNIWEFQARGADGKVVESAPGMDKFNVRGPGTLADLIEAATLLLNCKRLDAIRIGLPDPEYKLDPASVKPLGHTDYAAAEFGTWAPASRVAPIQLPTDPAVRAAHDRLIAEKMGVALPEDLPAPELPSAPTSHAAALETGPARGKNK